MATKRLSDEQLAAAIAAGDWPVVLAELKRCRGSETRLLDARNSDTARVYTCGVCKLMVCDSAANPHSERCTGVNP